MSFRIDFSAKFRENNAGDRTTPLTTQQQQIFTLEINDALSKRSRAGGQAALNPVSERLAVVENGDSLEKIARQNNVDLQSLLGANKGVFDNVNVLEANDVVILPPVSPELSAATQKDGGEQAFLNDVFDRGNKLEYAEDSAKIDLPAETGAIQQDVETYLRTLPEAERPAAAQRFLREDWRDAGPASTAVKAAAQTIIAEDLQKKAGSGDAGALQPALRQQIEAFAEADRKPVLQALYDRNWSGSGPAQTAIETVARDLKIELQPSSHKGPEIEAGARSIIDKARASGNPAAIQQDYDALYRAATPEIQAALTGNAEASGLIRTAKERQSALDAWVNGNDIDYEDVHGALKGENGDLGKLNDGERAYLLDRALAKWAQGDDLASNADYLAGSVAETGDTGLQQAVSQGLALRAANLNSTNNLGEEQKFEARALATAAARAGVGTQRNDKGQLDFSPLQKTMQALGPEKTAAFVQALALESGAPTSGQTDALANSLHGILIAANSGPQSAATSAAVQNVFALSNSFNPSLRPGFTDDGRDTPGAMATALAREWYPDDAAKRDSEASRLQSIFNTEEGRTLLFQASGENRLGLEPRMQALSIIRSDSSINGEKVGQIDDPWTNPLFTGPGAQETANLYLTSRGNEALTLPDKVLDNTVGVAMGLQPKIPDGMSAEEAQRKLANGEISLFAGGDEAYKPVQDIVNQIRTLGGSEPKVTILPVQYSSKELGPVTLPLFRVSTAQGDKFVDNKGRSYESFQDWKEHNDLPPGSMTYPTDGQLTRKTDGSMDLSQGNTPKTADTAGEHIENALDTVALVGGIVAGGVLIIGSGGTLTPVVAGAATAVAIGAGGWGAYRGASALADRAQHGQSINPFTDGEARMLWLNTAASAAAVGAFGSAARLTQIAGTGARLSPTMAKIAGTTVALSNTADAAAITNMAVYTVANWSKLPAEDRLNNILSMGFWGVSMGVGMRHGQSPKDIFNPIAQTNALLNTYQPQVIRSPDLLGDRVEIVQDVATGAIIIKAGPNATASDVALHVDVARTMALDNGLDGQIKSMLGQDNPKPGTLAHSIKYEQEKLSIKVDGLQAKLDNPALTPQQRTQLRGDILTTREYINQLQISAEIIAREPSKATIAAPSTGLAAAASYGLDKALDTGPYAGKGYYFRVNGQNNALEIVRMDGYDAANPRLAVVQKPDGSWTIEKAPEPPAKAPNGGLTTGQFGDVGEGYTRSNLQKLGYTEQIVVKNGPGHGVDIIARNPKTRQIIIAEVKTNGSELSPDQRVGGPGYAMSRLQRAADGEGAWAGLTPAERADAERALSWVLFDEADGYGIQYLEIKYEVDSLGNLSNPRHRDWSHDPDGRPDSMPWNPGDGLGP